MIDQLQFIRPDWFYAFIPLAIFIVLMFRRHGRSMSWKAVCDEHLLPHILTKATGKSSRFPLLLAVIATSLCILAAAGPVIKKLPQPVFREQSALIIIVDLSQSMNATDLRPSRLERAKLKLLDMLKARKGGQTALIVYASSAFVVTPLTDDTNTIANLAPTLETGLMPAQGSHAYVAINKAGELLQQAGVTRGHALLITDGLSVKDNDAIETFSTQGHRLSILGVGTTDGGPVPLNGGFLQDSRGAIVIPKLRPQQLQQAALKGGGMFVNLQADDSDVEQLEKLFSSRQVKPESETPTLGEMELTADTWQEEGPWLLLLALPFAALWSRKGWLLCLPVVALMSPEPSYAFELENLWRSNDQKAMRTFNAGDAKRAAEQFKDDRWKSSAHYRAGDYNEALDAMKQPANSDDFYNRANALAQLGRYPEAIKAYDEALELDADNNDASYNRELIKKEMQQQQGQPQGDQSEDDQSKDSQQQDQESSDSNSQPSEQGEQQDQQQKEAESQQQSSDAEQQQAQQDPSQPSDEQQQNNEDEANQALQDAQQQDQATDEDNHEESLSMNETSDNEAFDEDEQAIEQWLKRVPDDPGQLLRRKFHYQYKRMPNQVSDEQPW